MLNPSSSLATTGGKAVEILSGWDSDEGQHKTQLDPSEHTPRSQTCEYTRGHIQSGTPVDMAGDE